MKKIAIIFFALFTAFSAYCQTYIQDGDLCFDNGDYACAVTNYDNAFKNASGKDKQISEIKLTRSKWCAEHMKTANQEFNNKNYNVAKAEYESVLESNPKDSYVQSKLARCIEALNSPVSPSLRKATHDELVDVWNNKYGVMPERRQNLIAAGIDPDDVQKRVNRGEGKPSTITLSVENINISFMASGGSRTINVNTNASDYQITNLPWWCSVGSKDSHGFSLNCVANTSGWSRSEWFKVTAGDKVTMIYINQSGNVNSYDTKGPNASLKKSGRCFNCPNAKYTWGITAGFVQKSFDKSEGLLLGLRIEPLFKYGFGINTGVNLESYSSDELSYLYNEEDFALYVLNLPLHIEYRLNFSKWFNLFAYSGVGINIITNSLYDDNTTSATFDYGGGLRINHLQFNMGQSLYLGNSKHVTDFGIIEEPYQDLILSVSYMF